MLRVTSIGSLISVLLWAATPAVAADNGIYIGASLGQANIEEQDDLTGFDLDGDDTGYKAIVGIRPLDFLGFELSYVDLGQAEDSIAGVDFAADAKGIDAFAVGFLGLPFMDVFAKVGLISWDVDLSADGLGSFSEDGEDFAWGVGAQVRFGSAAVRAEYESFEVGEIDKLNMISIGFTWTFL